MARVETSAPPQARFGPGGLTKGTLYRTADGHLAFAVTATAVALLDHPTCSLMLLNRGSVLHDYVLGRFPFTRLADGESVTLTQSSEEGL